ncbi:type II toxin-antitoxin system VapC family toxin [Paenibacillus sp. PSB04]|uniref:type II toxin-antitoxin system VapC family toxin n=1 Tax=Paenibacillus sp. PSB04 TaxID=2866810 RepID=UPI0021F14112|nr:PIN domain-containing protein [Paenibacillus sp. PSB04]UYO05997.1 PIN domain-containing protein [Paenibacillus sp. PSB04]
MLNKVICDTNIYIYASWGFNPAMELINELRFDPEVELLLPTVIQTELQSIPRAHKDLAYQEVIHEFIRYPKEEGLIIDISDEIAKTAADLRVTWSEEVGKKLPLPDAVIAATAIEMNAQLLSNNDKDFSFAVDRFGLIDRTELDFFMKENNLAKPVKNLQQTFEKVCSKMHEDDLRKLASTLFNIVNQESKSQILMAFSLKRKRAE